MIGWPAYLLIGATGGPARGMTNHLLPDPMTPVDPKFPNKVRRGDDDDDECRF